MRIVLQGGTERENGAIAAALRSGGMAVTDVGDDRFDMIVTLGDAPSIVRVGTIEIDVVGRAARIAGRGVRLTQIEHALLVALARAARPLARTVLLETIWGYRFDPGTNLVAVHIHRLRAKIGHGRILCGRDGYRLADGEG